jgi:hypothetical protein
MKSVTKINKFERKNIPYNTALQELKIIYKDYLRNPEDIKRYLDKGIQLGNGRGVFYQILKEAK